MITTATLAKMVPFWGSLSKSRQEVMTEFVNKVGMLDFLTFRALHSAITRNNTEQVCAMLGGSLAERYRQG